MFNSLFRYRNEDKTSPDSITPRTQPRNYEAFCSRVDSFRPGLWNVFEVSPLECARWGWHIIEKDILQCITCQEVVCAALPNLVDRDAHEKFLTLLKDCLVNSHKTACGWRHNPSPKELTQPPSVTTVEQLHNMTNSAHSLAALGSSLPQLDQHTLMSTMKMDSNLINGMFTCSSTNEDAKTSSVLLVLSGWSRGEGAYLRCRICRRIVGLWSVVTRADELTAGEAAASSETEPDLGEHLSSHTQSEEVAEENKNIVKKTTIDNNDDDDDNDRLDSKWSNCLRGKRIIIEQGNKEGFSRQEELDDNNTRKKRQRMSGNDGSDINEAVEGSQEESSLLIIGSSPSSQIKKLEEKRYFHPLEEHRHWCPWVIKIQLENTVMKQGYEMVIDQIKELIYLSNRKDLSSSEKYAKNVEGLRSIRSMLHDLSEA
ncbi:zinc finger C3HC-type protein 1-like isoform X2 [Cherax quadricarinatus]|uniref:zinc finger C3HC-type protein 1-like isoform X2 n=1 Tax=Cherax quadricarinatus TaxID=27406 RepID=UPI00387E52DC